MNESVSDQFPKGVNVTGRLAPGFEEIITPDALSFVALLHRTFENRRKELLQSRVERQAQIDCGRMPSFLNETRKIRRDKSWQVGPIPLDLQNRRVEITGPVERKMMINALNSGANIFMADFEDAHSPTWQNNVEGHINLRDAIAGTISFTSPEGKQYSLNETVATLLVRPRGWHLFEKHLMVDNEPVAGAFMDFGLYFYHNAKSLLEQGTGPYFYLPKLESHFEARLWNDVFNLAQKELDLPIGTIKVTILIETVLAAFEIEEILYELKDHIVALNAGRWDYIFSVIKKFRSQPGFLLPDRSQITMTVPFMRSYTELLVKSCHKRGAHAIGGMAAFIPSRRDPEVNRIAISNVRQDKQRESQDGFDGTWVAHPDLVPIAREEFDKVLGDNPHQKDKLREDVKVDAHDLLSFAVAGGKITEAGLRANINVAIQYIDSWLRGIGAAGINNLMEDAATAEISRAQIWQWIHNPDAKLDDGRQVTKEMFQTMLPEELSKIRDIYGQADFASDKLEQAAEILSQLVTDEGFPEFLTMIAYKYLD
jgi:malate synthase